MLISSVKKFIVFLGLFKLMMKLLMTSSRPFVIASAVALMILLCLPFYPQTIEQHLVAQSPALHLVHSRYYQEC
mgnify:CR=1 FL=1